MLLKLPKHQHHLEAFKSCKHGIDVYTQKHALLDERLINNAHFSDAHSIVTNFPSTAQILNDTSTATTELDLKKFTYFVNNKVPGSTYFNIPFITTEQVFSFINSLDTSKATGLDGIGPKIIKWQQIVFLQSRLVLNK